MLELLQEQLKEYWKRYKQNEAECIQLMKEGKEWKETDMSNYDKPKSKKKIYIPGVRI